MGTNNLTTSIVDRKHSGHHAQLVKLLTMAAGPVAMFLTFTSISSAASNVTLTSGDKGGTTSFTGTANHWSASADSTLAAGAAPNAAYTYEVTGTPAASLLRTPTSGSAAFGGLSLQLDDGADLLLKTTGTSTVNGLIMNGGVVELDGATPSTVAGTISLNSGTTSYINSDSALALTVSAPISGSGALIVNGADALFQSNNTYLFANGYRADNPPAAGSSNPLTGSLTLTSSNSYSGGTTVDAGKLLVTVDGAFGTGNVSMLTGGSLTESGGLTNNYIANSATLTLSDASGGVDTLNYTGTDLVTALVIDGVNEPAGIYGGTSSIAPNRLAVFAGSGTVTVTGVPEPTTLAMGSLAGLMLLRRRRTA